MAVCQGERQGDLIGPGVGKGASLKSRLYQGQPCVCPFHTSLVPQTHHPGDHCLGFILTHNMLPKINVYFHTHSSLSRACRQMREGERERVFPRIINCSAVCFFSTLALVFALTHCKLSLDPTAALTVNVTMFMFHILNDISLFCCCGGHCPLLVHFSYEKGNNFYDPRSF